MLSTSPGKAVVKSMAFALFAAALCACGKGAMGDPGPVGDAGPPGPAASVRFQIVVASQTSSQTTVNRAAFAACPAGTKVIGGSCSCSPSPQVHVSESMTINTGPAAGAPGLHLCSCDPPSSVTDWIATAQATCVDGSGATVQ